MTYVDTDVLIIGSGFGAAAPALRLAQAGFRVVMVEKGPPIDPLRDFRQTQDPKYLLRYLKGLSGDNLSLTYAEALGGGSGFYEMVSLRAPSQAFAQVDHNGAPLWPAQLDRAMMDPYYDMAEQMLSVEQIAPHEVPKSGLVFAQMMKNLGYSCERARYAVRGCWGSGFCVTGCIYGAKQSLLLNYLPQAVEAGVTIAANHEVTRIRPLDEVHNTPRAESLHDTPYRYEVWCCESPTGNWSWYRTKMLILAGGAVGTAKLLLNAKTDLPLLSDQVGKNVAFNGGVKTAGMLPKHFPKGDMFVGRSHPGMISYEFLRSHGITISAGKPMPLQAVASARLRLDGDTREPSYWGTANVELMQQYRHRMMVLVAFGMTPPLGAIIRKENGSFETRLPLSDDLRSYYNETKELLHSIFTGNGCRIVEAKFVDGKGRPHQDLHFSTAHQVGSCRMADRKTRGVVDASGEVFDYPGMYVTDGAAIPSSLAVNTSLTILANAERIVAGILSRVHVGRPSAGVIVNRET